MEENPRFKNEDLYKKTNLKNYSKQFLNKLINTIEAKELPQINKKTFEPILGLWNKMLKEQLQEGFSTKETALLIYGLKTSIIKHMQETKKTKEQNFTL